MAIKSGKTERRRPQNRAMRNLFPIGYKPFI
jgi:hypothetical protein